MKEKKYYLILMVIGILFAFTSCSSLYTTVAKKDLSIKTQMSDTIWLNPVAPEERIVFLDVRNTSGVDMNIESKIKNILSTKGYRITNNPQQAKYWLQANILKLDKINLKESDGFDTVLGGGIGAIFGASRSGGVSTAIGWGLAGAALGTITDALVKDINYVMVTDLLISQKTSFKVKSTSKNQVKQGTSGVISSYSEATSNVEKYSTRVVSVANKVNLDFSQAKPELENELVKAISGIF